MLSRDQIQTLRGVRTDGQPVISLYVTFDRAEPDASKHLIALKNQIAQAKEWQASARASLEADWARLQRLVSEERVRGAKSLAVFACHAADLWRVFRLETPVAGSAIIAARPHLSPLIRAFGAQVAYGAVLIDKSRARLFLLRAGDVEERVGVFDEIPKRHRQGGRSQAGLQRHHDEAVGHHLKNTSDKLVALFKAEGFAGLLVGGKEPLLSEFKGVLHPYLHERLVGTFTLDMTAAPKAVSQHTRKLIEGHTATRIVQLADRLGGKTGVIGLADTLHALQSGQVMALLVEEDYTASGSRCDRCGALSLEAHGRCRYCQGNLQALDDVVSAVIEEAFSRGYEIRFVPKRGVLNKRGHIGAVLRYK